MRVSSATSTRIISSPEPGTCCIAPPVAQVPVGSKAELVIRRKERINSPLPQISWSQKAEKNFVFQGRLTLTSARMVMAPRVQRGAVYRKFPEDAMAL